MSIRLETHTEFETICKWNITKCTSNWNNKNRREVGCYWSRHLKIYIHFIPRHWNECYFELLTRKCKLNYSCLSKFGNTDIKWILNKTWNVYSTHYCNWWIRILIAGMQRSNEWLLFRVYYFEQTFNFLPNYAQIIDRMNDKISVDELAILNYFYPNQNISNAIRVA